jgi:hypothetical protein
VRRVAIAAVVIVVAAVLVLRIIEGYGPIATPGIAHLRAMKDRRDTPARFEDLRVTDIAALPAHRPLGEYERIERRGVRVEGYLQDAGRSADGDICLMLGDSPRREDPYVSVEITPAWSRGSREWTAARLTALSSAAPGRSPGDRPPRVRISGWLMYNLWADVTPGWVFDRPHRNSAWEIHPVTRIEYWDESKKSMVDLVR